MNSRILNREYQHPADGWYHIESGGEHPNRAAGVIQVVDSAAVAAIVNRFNRDAASKKLPQGSEMLIDHEHFKHDPSKETIAFGWLYSLEGRADGIYGKIRWSNTGQAAVDGADYRFFSTEYDNRDVAVLNRGEEPTRVRPLRLDGLTLTNCPNNRGAKPITNRGPQEQENEFSESTARDFTATVRATQEELKCSFHEAWNLVFNRGNFRATSKPRSASPPSVPANVGESSAPMNPAEIAARVLSDMAQADPANRAGGFEERWRLVCNRFPTLVKIANRDLGWDALQGIEPQAHATYSNAAPSFKSIITNLPEGVYGKDGAAVKVRLQFAENIRQLAITFPNLGFEGRYEKLKEVDPNLFWRYVATFSGEALPRN